MTPNLSCGPQREGERQKFKENKWGRKTKNKNGILALTYLDHAVLKNSAVVVGPGSDRRDLKLRVASVGPQRYWGKEVAHVAIGEADVYGPRDAGSTVKVGPPALYMQEYILLLAGHGARGGMCGAGDGG